MRKSKKKAASGQGSVFERNGRWVGQVLVQGQKVTKYFPRQQDAVNWTRDMMTQVRGGLTLESTQMSLEGFLAEWLGAIKESVRPSTLEQYEQTIHKHIIPELGKIKLKDLRPNQIQALYNEKLADGASRRTVILIHAILHRSLKQALLWGIIMRNPVEAVIRPKTKRKEMKTLTDAQVRTLLSGAETRNSPHAENEKSRYAVLYYLAVRTGMREGELLGLKWMDIDFVNNRLTIQRQLQYNRGKGLSFCEPKTAAGRRVIALSKATIHKLNEQRIRVNEERQIAGELWQENDLVFPTELGKPTFPTNLIKVFKELLKTLGLPNIRFHDLRHTAATLMLQQGIHPKVVQERLGHSDISMTLSIYSHVLPSMQEDAAEKLEELLTPIDVTDEIKQVKEQQAFYYIQ